MFSDKKALKHAEIGFIFVSIVAFFLSLKYSLNKDAIYTAGLACGYGTIGFVIIYFISKIQRLED